MTSCTVATAISESNMGEGQVTKKVKRHVLSSTFSSASNDIYWCGQALKSVGIVDRKGRYTSCSEKRPAVAGLFFNVGDGRSTTNVLSIAPSLSHRQITGILIAGTDR